MADRDDNADAQTDAETRTPTGVKVEPTNRPGRIFEEEAEEIATAMAPYTWYPQRSGRVDLVIQRAQETGKIDLMRWSVKKLRN